jgi:hypothetical protein
MKAPLVLFRRGTEVCSIFPFFRFFPRRENIEDTELADPRATHV